MKIIVGILAALTVVTGIGYVYRDSLLPWLATRQGTAYLAGVAGYDAVTPADVSSQYRTCEERLVWVRNRLGEYGMSLSDIKNAAEEWNVVPELVASVILNEMADYGWTDEFQDSPPMDFMRYGSNLGISQLSVSRLRNHNLRRGTDQQLQNCLLQPDCAANVAAGEVRWLVDHLNNSQRQGHHFAVNAWGTMHPENVDRSGRYYSVEQRRWLQNVYAITAAYNNPSIVTNWNPNKHGDPHYIYGDAKSHDFGGSLIHATNADNLFGRCFLDPAWRTAMDEGRLTGNCSGSVTASVYQGYEGSPLSFTIKVYGQAARSVQRVTTYNPKCQDCEATKVRDGTFKFDTYFVGNGPWNLRFYAQDYNGNEVCSGSSAQLRSLGSR